MRGEWNGNEDLGDGSLQALYADYKARCVFVKGVVTPARSRLIASDARKLLLDLEGDLEFLTAGAEVANDAYSKAIDSGKSDHIKMELAWTVVGFEEKVKKVRTFQTQLEGFAHDVASGDLISLKSDFLTYLKDLFSKKCTAATHVLVFRIADELRNRKPYAVPLRFMPYKSLTDSKLRDLELELEEAMRNAGMTVVGM